jgi:ubiquinone/menaquinone biosynthesis C-methylase UbiE
MSTTQNDATADNAIPIAAWNTVLFDKFTRFRPTVSDALGHHSSAVLSRLAYGGADRILDVGCGFGDTTLQIASRLGPDGWAVGVDCAPNFTSIARSEAAAAGVRNIDYFTADVQTEDLRGPYDHAFSRFGTMFFNLPGAALRNIRLALKPGGSFTMIVWRKREDNPWIYDAELCVKQIVPVVSHEETDQVHCGPGPFSMAGADLVSDMLISAGFDRVRFERLEIDLCIGRDLDEAIEVAMAIGPAGEIIRLAGEEGERLRPRVVEALKGLLAPKQRDGGVWDRSSSWIVGCVNPG